MHKTLTVPEILLNIFPFLERASNARNARVCKAWSEMALDFVWSNAGPEVFFSLAHAYATEYTYGTPSCISFWTRPTIKEWARFLKNAERVREWSDEPCGDVKYTLSPSAVRDVLYMRTTVCLFPNLKRIDVGSHKLEPYLFSEGVEALTLMLTMEGPISYRVRIPYALKDVEERLPGLQDLTITYIGGIDSYDHSLASLFSNLRRLRFLTLPFQCLDASLALVLSRHTRLENIRLGSSSLYNCYPSSSLRRPLYRPTLAPLPPNAFPSLTVLSFSAETFPDARAFISQPNFPASNLVTLWVHIEMVPSSSEVGQVLDAMASVFTGLHELVLCLSRLQYPWRARVADLKAIGAIHCQDLASISQFFALQSFTIIHPYPIKANSDADLDAIAAPHLKCLILNPHPIVPGPTNLTLNAYMTLSEHCPYLEDIGLFVDAEKPIHLSATSSRRLTARVHIGSSPVPVMAEAHTKTYPTIARFFSSIFSASCAWTYPGESDVFAAQVIDKEEWLPDLTDRHETALYLQGWKTIETMIGMEWAREIESEGLHQRCSD